MAKVIVQLSIMFTGLLSSFDGRCICHTMRNLSSRCCHVAIVDFKVRAGGVYATFECAKQGQELTNTRHAVLRTPNPKTDTTLKPMGFGDEEQKNADNPEAGTKFGSGGHKKRQEQHKGTRAQKQK